jgi:hypothetical protein
MATEAARLECEGIHRKKRENRKKKTSLQERKTSLTLTGLLMEGLDHISFFNWSRVFIWQTPVLLLQRNLKVAVRRH